MNPLSSKKIIASPASGPESSIPDAQKRRFSHTESSNNDNRLRIKKLIGISLLVSILLLAGIPVLLLWVLPEVAENQAVRILGEKGIFVKSFPVDVVGPGNTRIASGGLEYSGHSLDWEAIDVQYRLRAFLGRGVDRLEIQNPVLNLDFSDVPGSRETVSPMIITAPEETVIPAIEKAVNQTENEAAVTEPEDRPPAEDVPLIANSVSNPSWEPEETTSWSSIGLFKLIHDFPISEVLVEDGQAGIIVPGQRHLLAAWKGKLLKTNDLLTGELSLAGNGFDSSFSLNGMESARFFSARAGANFDLSQSGSIIRDILETEFGLDELPNASLPRDVSVEFLAETVPGNQLAASGQASSGNMSLEFPEHETLLLIDSIHLAASASQARALTSAGVRFGDSIILGTGLSPFGLALTLDQSGLVTAESEEIIHRHKSWSAKTAIRGRGFLDEAGLLSGRLEWAFDGIQGPWVELESFSTLLETDTRLVKIQSSPLGLKRNGILWIEQAEMYWDLTTREGEGSLEWYGTSGALAGYAKGSISIAGKDTVELFLEFSESPGSSVMEIHYENGERLTFDSEGNLPVGWINSIGSWWGNVLPGRLHGGDPFIHISLEGKLPFLKGNMGLSLQDSGFTSDGGIILEGIQFESDLLVNTFPKTVSPQQLQIHSIKMGRFLIENLRAEWELPVIHRLHVNQLEADLGDGEIWIDPLSFNPLNPVINAELFFRGLPAGQVLGWMDEKRFSMDGTLSGSLKIGWENGAMLLGEGQFRIDPANTDNYFRFLDPEFVDEYFSALGSAPAELKERFRDALLEKGIRLDELEVTFRSAQASGQVSLRISMSGETKTELLEIPIKGIVINNLISEEDIGHLLGLLGPVRMMSSP